MIETYEMNILVFSELHTRKIKGNDDYVIFNFESTDFPEKQGILKKSFSNKVLGFLNYIPKGIQLIHKDDLEEIRVYGYHGKDGSYPTGKILERMQKEKLIDFYDEESYILIENHWESHNLKIVETGDYVPLPIITRHCDGFSISNENYEINKLREHLSENDQISDLKFEDVPYYNAQFYGHKELCFKFIPTQEQVNKAISDGIFEKLKYPNWHEWWQFNDDILGLKQFERTEK